MRCLLSRLLEDGGSGSFLPQPKCWVSACYSKHIGRSIKHGSIIEPHFGKAPSKQIVEFQHPNNLPLLLAVCKSCLHGKRGRCHLMFLIHLCSRKHVHISHDSPAPCRRTPEDVSMSWGPCLNPNQKGRDSRFQGRREYWFLPRHQLMSWGVKFNPNKSQENCIITCLHLTRPDLSISLRG